MDTPGIHHGARDLEITIQTITMSNPQITRKIGTKMDTRTIHHGTRDLEVGSTINPLLNLLNPLLNLLNPLLNLLNPLLNLLNPLLNLINPLKMDTMSKPHITREI
jgi:hypothetical protein